MRRLAVLEAAVEQETPFGGRSRLWEAAADLWVALTPGPARVVADRGGRPRLVETARAVTRDHPEAERGMRLGLDGRSWTVLRVERGAPAPGRMTLHLESESE
ncbi:MAG TPA: hypothetical protein VD929_00515 [Caulobacteraceae bacterium]|nr:hypothetical protein [Caulobacteraceae bacterium]